METRQIEIREFTKYELLKLLSEAPKTETRNINRLVRNPYEFFKERCVRQSGLIINKRPIYFWVLTLNKEKERFELWTIANSNIKEQFTLFKTAKKISQDWVKIYKALYATMEKVNPKNISWAKRLGFRKVSETKVTITLKLEV